MDREVANYFPPVIKKQKEINIGWSSAHFLLLIQSGAPAHGLVPPTFRVCLLAPLKPLWNYSRRHTHDVILSSLELIVKISRYNHCL